MIEKILKVLKTERECINRQSDINRCDRMCGRCDLRLEDTEILEVYDFLINGYEMILDGNCEEFNIRVRGDSDA